MTILSNETCIIEFFSLSPRKVVLNVLRVSIAFLYLFWILLVLRMTNLRKRGMAYLYNLAFNGLFYALVGIYYSTWSSCYRPSVFVCYISSFLTTYLTYYSGYAMGALLLYRLICVTHANWIYNLSYIKILASIALVWIIPVLCALVEMFVFTKQISYKPKAQLCSNEYFDFFTIIAFFSLFGVIVPNTIILCAYFASLTYLKRLRRKIRSNRRTIEPPRIKVQLAIYIVLYVVTCVTNLIATIPLNFPGLIIPLNYLETFFYSVRLFNWIRHILPLGLMYFNADLLEEYKALLSKYCCSKKQNDRNADYNGLR